MKTTEQERREPRKARLAMSIEQPFFNKYRKTCRPNSNSN